MNKKWQRFLLWFIWGLTFVVLEEVTFWMYDTGILFDSRCYMYAVVFGWMLWGACCVWFDRFMAARYRSNHTKK